MEADETPTVDNAFDNFAQAPVPGRCGGLFGLDINKTIGAENNEF